MNIISKLKKKYSKRLKEAKCPRDKDDFDPTIYILQKWNYKSAGKGWYLCDLGSRAPFVYALIIDEFLEWLDTKCPDFKIQQIKTKYNSLRIYILFPDHEKGNFIEEIRGLESWLEDERLVY